MIFAKKEPCQRCHLKRKVFPVKTDKYTALCDDCCRDYLEVTSEKLERHVRNFVALAGSPNG